MNPLFDDVPVGLFDNIPPHLCRATFRALSKMLHPDAGGDTAAMQWLGAQWAKYEAKATDRPQIGEQGDPAGLLDEVVALLRTYVVLPDAAAYDAIALYVAATHAQPAWDSTTRLHLRSPVKRCGKTRLLWLLLRLCHHPLPTTNISVAALVRSINEIDPPTILLDEADAIFISATQTARKTFAAS